MTIWKERTEVIYKDDSQQQQDIFQARTMVADVIDYANSFLKEDSSWEKKRCIAKAMTELEDWLMWLVKWITRD